MSTIAPSSQRRGHKQDRSPFSGRCGDCYVTWPCPGFLREELERATQLLRWYVESDLADGGDEFGAWDDEVREFVGKTPQGGPG